MKVNDILGSFIPRSQFLSFSCLVFVPLSGETSSPLCINSGPFTVWFDSCLSITCRDNYSSDFTKLLFDFYSLVSPSRFSLLYLIMPYVSRQLPIPALWQKYDEEPPQVCCS